MRKYFEAPEVFGTDGKFNFLTERPYEPIAWAYVERRKTNGAELLVAEKPNGMLVIPGGHIKKHEDSLEAARRECYEETGVQTIVCNDSRRFKREVETYIVVKPRGAAVAVVTSWGTNYGFWVAYRDKPGKPGKNYRCHIEELNPVEGGEPREMAGSDVKNPRFMPLEEVLGNRHLFTPAVQIFLELLEGEATGDILRPSDLLVLPDHRLGQYLRVEEPTEV